MRKALHLLIHVTDPHGEKVILKGTFRYLKFKHTSVGDFAFLWKVNFLAKGKNEMLQLLPVSFI